jgi:hypothetical protein
MMLMKTSSIELMDTPWQHLESAEVAPSITKDQGRRSRGEDTTALELEVSRAVIKWT